MFLDIPDFGGDDPAFVVPYMQVYRDGGGTGTESLDLDIFQNHGQGGTLFSGFSRTYDPGESRFFQTVDTDADAGTDHIRFRADATGGTYRFFFGLWAISTHSHSISGTSTTELGITNTQTSDTAVGVEPGINTTFDTPTDVDVLVNGSTVATNIGSGTFQTTVDLSGELNQNAWNTIELTSDSLGRIQASTFLQGYDQIGTQ
jgi:hypothetical protein